MRNHIVSKFTTLTMCEYVSWSWMSCESIWEQQTTRCYSLAPKTNNNKKYINIFVIMSIRNLYVFTFFNSRAETIINIIFGFFAYSLNYGEYVSVEYALSRVIFFFLFTMRTTTSTDYPHKRNAYVELAAVEPHFLRKTMKQQQQKLSLGHWIEMSVDTNTMSEVTPNMC